MDLIIVFDKSKAGVKKMNSDASVKQHLWFPIERIEASIRLRVNKESSAVIKRSYFQLMLSWACRLHKVQGLREGYPRFNLFKHR